jgi:AcrR family transcriptional regulator
MLYYYFGSKDDLYDAVVERIIGQVAEMASGLAVAQAAAGRVPSEDAMLVGSQALSAAWRVSNQALLLDGLRARPVEEG